MICRVKLAVRHSPVLRGSARRFPMIKNILITFLLSMSAFLLPPRTFAVSESRFRGSPAQQQAGKDRGMIKRPPLIGDKGMVRRPPAAYRTGNLKRRSTHSQSH